MIVIEGTFRAPDVAAALPVMLGMIISSRAEPGCLEYAYALDVMDATLIRVTEKWESREALEAHFQSPHVTEWRKAWPALGITDRDLRLYEADPEDI